MSSLAGFQDIGTENQPGYSTFQDWTSVSMWPLRLELATGTKLGSHQQLSQKERAVQGDAPSELKTAPAGQQDPCFS